jgi:hypothetical protein
MSKHEQHVETFESGANQRGLGSISHHDLAAMKTQLASMEQMVAQYARATGRSASANIYPVIVPEKPLPSTPVPEGVAENVESVMATITAIMARISDFLGATNGAATSGSATNGAATNGSATTKIHVRSQPSFSRTLPSRSVVPEPEVASELPPPPYIPVESEIKAAHAKLDMMIEKCASMNAKPIDFVIATGDEYYCLTQFRQMMAERTSELTKNFASQFSKLRVKS